MLNSGLLSVFISVFCFQFFFLFYSVATKTCMQLRVPKVKRVIQGHGVEVHTP